MPNPENILKANAARTPKKRRENARKAGIASGIAKREHKTIRECMLAALDAVLKGKDGQTMTAREAMVAKQVQRAIKEGDVSSYRAILDTVGEGAAQKLEINAGVTVTPDFGEMTAEQIAQFVAKK